MRLGLSHYWTVNYECGSREPAKRSSYSEDPPTSHSTNVIKSPVRLAPHRRFMTTFTAAVL